MNDDDIKNTSGQLPQVILATNGPYINGNADFTEYQHVTNMNSIHPQQQPQIGFNEWSDTSNNELLSSILGDDFLALNDSALDEISLGEILLLNEPLNKLGYASICHDLAAPTASNQPMMAHSSASDFSASTSFHTSPASDSQSMLYSSTNDLSASTSFQSSPASSGQSMIQSPPSYYLEPLPQQNDSGNILPELDICIQPENTFRFRYKSETKDPHGYLRGARSIGNNLRKHTTVDLRLPRLNHSTNVEEQFFVRCTLHQATSPALIHAPLSPHQLLRRSDGKLYDETELFIFRKVAQNFYSFQLDNFLITLTPIDQCQQNCLDKLEALSQQSSDLRSNLVLNVSGADLEEPKAGTKKKKKQTLKPIQVQIGFEAFRLINGAYTSIAGPKFSNIITHGEPLNITKICNLCVSKDEVTEVTLLVSTLKTIDIKIHLQECGNIANPWSDCIDVNKKMVHQKSAISFQMPRYNGNQQHLANIECSIQLERICDGARSNIRYIFYTNGLKRCRPSGDTTISTIAARKPRIEDHLQVSPNSLKLQSDAVLFTDTSISRKDSEKLSSCARRIARTTVQSISKECITGPFIDDIQFVAEMNVEFENIKKPNKELISFLCDIRNWYNESKNTAIGKKQNYARLVRHYFLAYEREHPEGNSILHDVLADTDLQEYEIVLYKITEHFELEDLVSQSRNIYGETALMFACMLKRPLLISALINMGTSIEAQDIDNGNNVLHIAMKQQSAECHMGLLQAMKKTKNPTSFIKALSSHNLRGLTPLHLAVLQNNVPIVAELLQFCKRHKALEACQRGQLTDGNTILHLAVLNRFVAMRACILEHSDGSFINLINFSDQTAEEIMLDVDEELENLIDSLGSTQLQ